jgi:hypothetical protein
VCRVNMVAAGTHSRSRRATAGDVAGWQMIKARRIEGARGEAPSQEERLPLYKFLELFWLLERQ